jgi:hypothetical protein
MTFSVQPIIGTAHLFIIQKRFNKNQQFWYKYSKALGRTYTMSDDHKRKISMARLGKKYPKSV